MQTEMSELADRREMELDTASINYLCSALCNSEGCWHKYGARPIQLNFHTQHPRELQIDRLIIGMLAISEHEAA